MNKPDQTVDDLVLAAAAVAARRELAVVKAAMREQTKGALVDAFLLHRRFVRIWMGVSDAKSDIYCLARLRELGARGLPADEDFICDVTQSLIQLTKGTSCDANS